MLLGLFLLLVVIVMAWQANIIKKFLQTMISFGIPIAVMLFIIQGLYSPQNHTYVANLGFAKLGLEGLMYGGKLLVTLLVFMGSFYLFNKTIYSGELAAALIKSSLSDKGGYLILASLNVVPQMKRQLQVIKEAQEARGVQTGGSLLTRIKVFIPLMGPVILSSLIDTQERGMALELRGFDLKNVSKTSYIQVVDTKLDKLFRIGMLLFLIIVTAFSIYLKVRR
ncbi:hypothetical protein FC96_GL001457 [Secundilactobacillus kimchicus JCM 15530]|uniref:Cobalt transport protein n=2 Tax=Secundilactobacillus kimchicus TaxID=528209 RepID=A0A0R1HNF8_9LACO|nr:hypothetical protein FC96_GL001457 [Secundilactobacillus kimchicus JCM 15530]